MQTSRTEAESSYLMVSVLYVLLLPCAACGIETESSTWLRREPTKSAGRRRPRPRPSKNSTNSTKRDRRTSRKHRPPTGVTPPVLPDSAGSRTLCRLEEKNRVEDRRSVEQHGTQWEKVARLIDLAPKASEQLNIKVCCKRLGRVWSVCG